MHMRKVVDDRRVDKLRAGLHRTETAAGDARSATGLRRRRRRPRRQVRRGGASATWPARPRRPDKAARVAGKRVRRAARRLGTRRPTTERGLDAHCFASGPEAEKHVLRAKGRKRKVAGARTAAPRCSSGDAQKKSRMLCLLTPLFFFFSFLLFFFLFLRLPRALALAALGPAAAPPRRRRAAASLRAPHQLVVVGRGAELDDDSTGAISYRRRRLALEAPEEALREVVAAAAAACLMASRRASSMTPRARSWRPRAAASSAASASPACGSWPMVLDQMSFVCSVVLVIMRAAAGAAGVHFFFGFFSFVCQAYLPLPPSSTSGGARVMAPEG